ncbi:MAG: hypothetical protein ABUL60_13655 [Myxococcales bacterium]
MSSRSINRKDFLVLTVSSAAITAFLEACSDDPATPLPGTAGTGTGGSGTAGTGTAGTGTAGTGTAGTGTAGTGTAGTGTAGTGTAGTGTAGTASGGMAGTGAGGKGGSGGAAGGSGGASGGSGGASGGSGGGAGGGGGGMCGAVSIMQTSAEAHDHIPADPTMLKADLKALINGATPTMNFNVPMDMNHTHVLKLTVQEAMTLKGGGMITGKKTETDATNHTHTYTIGCSA